MCAVVSLEKTIRLDVYKYGCDVPLLLKSLRREADHIQIRKPSPIFFFANMQFTKTALFALLSFAVANPLPAEGTSETTELQLAANCNHSIGNCYDNDCDGNPTTLVCLGVRTETNSQGARRKPRD